MGTPKGDAQQTFLSVFHCGHVVRRSAQKYTSTDQQGQSQNFPTPIKKLQDKLDDFLPTWSGPES
jgi:hypothetical protein